jgi:hypothetical protein
MNFKLYIEFGNEAMETWQDLAAVLRKLAKKVDNYDCDMEEQTEVIMDLNGNRVGTWSIEENE